MSASVRGPSVGANKETAMSPAVPSVTPDDSPPSALALRDRILSALLADGSAVLTHRDQSLARLRLVTGAEVALVTCSADTPPADLRSTLDSLVRDSRAALLHLVAVGGERDVRQALKKSIPFWQF